ncbi:MAG: hypothetical protein PHI50_03690 [Alphaproteobacteria bacterium]|nr:hypothetical protein [Alphaproteobacteria bacterium]
MHPESQFKPLVNALLDFSETKESYDAFDTLAKRTLGDDWAEELKQWEETFPQSEKVSEKVKSLLNYRGALLAWNEANEYLSDPKSVTTGFVKDRLPVLEYWLDFFGDAGKGLLEQLKRTFIEEKFSSDEEETEENEEQEELEESVEERASLKEEIEKKEPKEEVSLSKEEQEKLWKIQNFSSQKAFYNQVLEWINARCIHLGHIEKMEYPYYGFSVDILKELKTSIDELLKDTKSYDFINAHSEENVDDLKRFKESIERELEIQKEAGFEPILSIEDIEVKKAKDLLGNLDASKEKEYLGPAPDGFVALDDPFQKKGPVPSSIPQRRIPVGRVVGHPPIQGGAPVRRPMPPHPMRPRGPQVQIQGQMRPQGQMPPQGQVQPQKRPMPSTGPQKETVKDPYPVVRPVQQRKEEMDKKSPSQSEKESKS